MNCANYIPNGVTSSKDTQFLMYDQNGAILVSHDLVNEKGTVVFLKEFNDTRR